MQISVPFTCNMPAKEHLFSNQSSIHLLVKSKSRSFSVSQHPRVPLLCHIHSIHPCPEKQDTEEASDLIFLSSPTQRFLRKNHGPRTIFNILFHFSLKPPSFSKYPQQKRYEILNAAKMYTSAICWIHLIFLKWKHLWKEICRQKSYNPYHK